MVNKAVGHLSQRNLIDRELTFLDQFQKEWQRPLKLTNGDSESFGHHFTSVGTDGAPIIKSRPSPVFGKAITSRIFGSSNKMLSNRSRPQAIPPWGGAPKLNALSIWPKLSS